MRNVYVFGMLKGDKIKT